VTWPADGLPRYKVASVPKADVQRGQDWRPIGYVFDRGYAHRAVLAIRDTSEKAARSKAERAALALNSGDELTPELRGERPHGWRRYKYDGCRCTPCRTDYNTRQRARKAGEPMPA
jgi:hypothetical protein